MPPCLPSPVRRAAALVLLCAGFAGCASVGPGATSLPEHAARGAAAAPRASAPPQGAATTDSAASAVRVVPVPSHAPSDLAIESLPSAEPGAPIGAAPVMTRERGPTDVPAASTRSLWDRVRAGFAMPELRSPLVEQRVRWYTARPELLERMFERGAPYLYFIVEEVTKRGLPTELALLPFVESAMNPVATSHAAAAGLWQFIPATGRRFDLSQDWWIDERRDVVESTRAALDYLQEVYAMHGQDWFLALASYNWGEGAVARAVEANRRRGRPTDYASLKMPDETRHYVPKLLALKRIVQDASPLGVNLPPVPDAPYFVTIEHPVPMDLKLAARFADMSVEDFVALNPAHNRPVIAANRNAELRLPVDRVALFLAAAERHASQRRPFITWRPHTMRSGETVESLAARSGTTPAEIRRANGLPPTHRALRPGSRLLVPSGNVVDASYVESFDAAHLVFQPPPKAPAKARRGGHARGAARHPVKAREPAPRRGSAAAARVRGPARASAPARVVPAAGRPSAQPQKRTVSAGAKKRAAPAARRR